MTTLQRLIAVCAAATVASCELAALSLDGQDWVDPPVGGFELQFRFPADGWPENAQGLQVATIFVRVDPEAEGPFGGCQRIPLQARFGIGGGLSGSDGELHLSGFGSGVLYEQNFYRSSIRPNELVRIYVSDRTCLSVTIGTPAWLDVAGVSVCNVAGTGCLPWSISELRCRGSYEGYCQTLSPAVFFSTTPNRETTP